MYTLAKASPQIKTIRFEAKPLWETNRHIKTFVDDSSVDKKRSENYMQVKEILNKYAREVIKKATEDISYENITPTYELIETLYFSKKNASDKTTRAKYDKATGDFKKHIVEVTKRYATEHQLAKAQADLFNVKKSKLLNDFDLNDEEKELIMSYHGFTSYFSKYFTTLTETILFGVDGGSVSNRIIENMEIYFDNIQNLELIQENCKELYEILKDKVAKMHVTMSMSQKGIDSYNALIGNTKNDGINSLISEYKQKNRVKVSLLKRINKIPLSEIEKQIVIKSIEDEAELENTINETISLGKDIILFAKQSCKTLPEQDKEDVFVKENKLNELSLLIYGEWSTLGIALKSYYVLNDVEHKEGSSVSLAEIEKAIEMSDYEPKTTLVNALKRNLSNIISAENDIDEITAIVNKHKVLNKKKEMREFLDKLLTFSRAVSMFDLERNESMFIIDVIEMQDKLQMLVHNYNLIRNYCTKNPIQIKKWSLFFDKSSFLSSFDFDKFQKGETLATILRKDDLFYFMVLNPIYGNKLEQSAYTIDGDGYEQLVYKQLTGVNKMFPKCFLSKTGEEKYSPSAEILKIVREKLYTKEAEDKESLTKWIAFCIESFKKNKEWTKNFSPKFRKPEEYESANEFYTEIERSLIRMDFSKKISEDYLKKAVEEGKIFLFQIYCKDFSPSHKGEDDSYALILKELFSDENLRRLNETDETAIKLASGGSTLTFRPASIPYKETHPANVPIKNKNPLNPKKESVYPYPICKDKRYMFDKFHVSFAIQIGFRNQEVNPYDLNRKVNEYVVENKPNVLTIRAGERHLLYYMVNDCSGKVLEEGSLNIITSKSNYNNHIVKTDYKDLLIRREKEIKEAKEKWDYSKDIKTIKAGYMSMALHEIVELQQKYNAVIVVENFSSAFLQGRMKNMKNIYQQFQKALLQKLSCFVIRNKKYCDAIQLAYPASTFNDLKGQCGIVYFVNPSYTSNTDFTTGFVNQFTGYFVYENKKQAETNFLKTKISYDTEKQEFVIGLDEKDFGLSNHEKKWYLHTSGERTIFKDGRTEYYDCTEELSWLFKTYNISDFNDFSGVKLSKKFYEKFFEIIRVMLRLHYSDIDTFEEYTLSPIENNQGERLDTRNNQSIKNSAAVKTYLLYMKGARDLENIDNETMLIARDKKGEHKDKWIEYINLQT